MKSLFQMGIQGQKSLGQWGFLQAVAPSLISAAGAGYSAYTERKNAKDLLDFRESQAAAAAVREQAAIKIQEDALKEIQESESGAGGGGKILGMETPTFLVVAGLGAGVLVLGTILLTQK